MEKRNVTITPAEFLEKLRHCFEAGGRFPLRITGNSMAPFLRPGRDSVVLAPVEGELKKGDIALFLRPGGDPILHRVVKVSPEGYFFLGDGQARAEGPIPRGKVIAVAVGAFVDGHETGPGRAKWEFYRRVWRIMPLRRLAWRIRGAGPAGG